MGKYMIGFTPHTSYQDKFQIRENLDYETTEENMGLHYNLEMGNHS